MSEVNYWFPTLIYHASLDTIDNKQLLDNVYSLRDKYSDNSPDWKCDMFATMGKECLTSYREYDSLFTESLNHMSEFSENFNLNKKQIKIDYAWANISQTGNYQEFHNHPNSHFSAVYYLKVPENSGSLVFKSHSSFFEMFTLPIKDRNDNTYESVTYNVKESMLVIFRSNMYHMVTTNKSNEDRVSIAINFSIK